MRSGWNGSRPVELLAGAGELDRLAGHLAHRERGAAARIAVELGQDDAGERQPLAERARHVDRVLALHRVHHEQRLDRLAARRAAPRSPASSARRSPGARPCRRSGRRSSGSARARGPCCAISSGFSSDVGSKELHPHLRRQPSSAARSRRAGRRRRKRRSTFFFCPLRSRASLPAVVVLPEPCRPAIRITAGGCDGEIERRRSPRPSGASSSRCTTPTSACPGVRLPITSSPSALRAHRVDEMLHHRQRDVGLEQRDAHFAQRVLDVGLGEARLAADRLDDPARGARSGCRAWRCGMG